MKKQLQIRSFNLRPDKSGMEEDLVVVNNYLQQAEVMHAFAVSNRGDESAVLLFMEYIKENRKTSGKNQAEEEVKVSEQKIISAEELKIIERLKVWRSAKASELQLPVFMILTNMAIDSIALDLPQTLTQLTALKGMGPIRAQKYGKEILELLNAVPA